jgi:hypothetical protein
MDLVPSQRPQKGKTGSLSEESAKYNQGRRTVMTHSVEALLHSFDRLPAEARREAAAQILKRTVEFDLPLLSDLSLIESADQVFTELDRAEAEDA